MAFPLSARAASLALVLASWTAGSDVAFSETVESAEVFAFSSATFSTVFWSSPHLSDTAKNSLHVSRALNPIEHRSGFHHGRKQSTLILVLLIVDDLIANVTPTLPNDDLLTPPGLNLTESGTTVHEVLKVCDPELLRALVLRN